MSKHTSAVAALEPAIFTIVEKRWEYEGVATFDLEPQDNSMTWRSASPGQFSMLYAFGVGEAAISFSALPAKKRRYVCTIRNAGAITGAITKLKQGDSLGLRGPFGHGWPMDALHHRDIIVVAGGLGLAPLKPVIEQLAITADDGQNIHVLCGARNPELILFRTDLERWREEAALNVRVIVDAATADWRGDVGLVTNLISEIDFRPEETTAFICGPELMMRFSAEALLNLGVEPRGIWLSMERNMKCAVGFCGHCQFGPAFICRDGPVFRYDVIRDNLLVKEL
ncbi:MAG: FAD/NAD(P)-binding protein [Pseudomonadota bacterium]